MQVIESAITVRRIVEQWKKEGKTVGFVPTMGALHQGHISLAEIARANNNYVVVSIFVNPTQFNDKNDLKNYPRTLDADLDKLRPYADIVFNPSENEMYPKPDNRVFDFGTLDKVMEGAFRPGHFNGVAQIVSKLFDAVPAHRGYFGDKDFQQVAIIQQMVKQLHIPVEIVPCPIIRELDGLAMSSRNMLLSEVQRANVSVISQTLFESKKISSSLSVEELKAWVIGTINKNPELNVEYFEIANVSTLTPVKSWNDPCDKVGCIAVKCGKIRLIDNIRY